jgi:hypothetical protein
MESECSLQCSQEPATGPYPEPDASNPHRRTEPSNRIDKALFLFHEEWIMQITPHMYTYLLNDTLSHGRWNQTILYKFVDQGMVAWNECLEY